MKLVNLIILVVLVYFSCVKDNGNNEENILEFPRNLKVKSGSITSDAFTVEWSKVDQADSYELVVEYKSSGSGITGSPFKDISNSTSGSKLEKAISGLLAETEYRFKVKSKKGDDFSKFTDYVSVKTLKKSVPPKPNNLRAKLGATTSNSFIAQWDIDNADSYELVLERSGSAITGSPFTVSKPSSGSKVEKAITGLTPNTEYKFKVRGKYSSEYSNYTQEESVTTSIEKQDKPSGFILKKAPSSEGNYFEMEWDRDANAELYELEIIDASTNLHIHNGVSKAPFKVTNPSSGNKVSKIVAQALTTTDNIYKCKLRIKYKDGSWSKYTAAVSVKTLKRHTGRFSVKTGTLIKNGLTLEWDRDTDAKYYELSIVDGSGSYIMNPTNINNPSSGNVEKAITVATAGDYTAKLRVKYNDGSWSLFSEYTLHKYMFEAYSINLRLKGKTISSFKLEWGKMAGAEEYDLEVKDDSGTQISGSPFKVSNSVSSSKLEKELQGLTANTTYEYRIKTLYPNNVYTDWTTKATVTTDKFEVSSTAFKDKEPYVHGGGIDLPSGNEHKRTCNGITGNNKKIPLKWNVPTGTDSFVIFMDDTYNTGYRTHWIEVNIPKTTTSTTTNADDGTLLKNRWGNQKYDGPCPPSGTGLHTYKITLFALDTAISRDNIAAYNFHFYQTATLSTIRSIIENSNINILEEASIYFKLKQN